MKRFFLSALVSMLACISINAQDIVGRWTTSLYNTSKEGLDVVATSTELYTDDGKFKENLVIDAKQTDEKGNSNKLFMISISYVGTWSVSNNILTKAIDGKSFDSEVKDYTGEMPKMVINMLKNSCTAEIKKSVKKPSHKKIELLTESELKVKDIDDEESPVVTYKRQ